MAIKLELSGLSLTIENLLDSKLPRVVAEPLPKVEYSIAGSAIGSGTAYEGKHIWAINALVSSEEATILQTIYSESDTIRRASTTDPSILVTDTYQLFVERSPRTRVIAPGTSEVPQGLNHIAYYAKFKAWMVKPPELTDRGVVLGVSFTLQETTKVSA